MERKANNTEQLVICSKTLNNQSNSRAQVFVET